MDIRPNASQSDFPAPKKGEAETPAYRKLVEKFQSVEPYWHCLTSDCRDFRRLVRETVARIEQEGTYQNTRARTIPWLCSAIKDSDVPVAVDVSITFGEWEKDNLGYVRYAYIRVVKESISGDI